MSLADLGNIGEFFGAIGVVVTLIYLAYQIRQNTEQLEENTRASKAAAVNASTESLRENRRAIYESADLSDIFRRGLLDPDHLNESEIYRFRLMFQNAVDAMWDMYTHTKSTGYMPEAWEANGVSFVHRVLGSEGGKWFWKRFKNTYPEDFQEEIHMILTGNNPEIS